MRSVGIFLNKNSIFPGETLAGQVTIRTSKSFDCNRVVLKVIGKEKTVHGSGEYQTTQESYHISRVFRILEGGIVPEGITRIPFAVRVPKGIPPSYKGYNGSIEYTIESVVEVNWTLDPKVKESFYVLQERPPKIPSNIDIRPLTDTSGSLHVQLDSNVLRKKRGINVRFMVSKRSRLRGIQLEIKRREEAKCYQFSMKQDTILDDRYYPLSTDDLGIWKEIRLGEGWSHELAFCGNLISVSYLIKVCLDVSLGFDPEVIIPLRISDEAPFDDVLDAIESDLGWF